MQTRHRLAAWTLGVVLSGAVWPIAGYAFANVEVGAKIDNVSMPMLQGGKHELIAKKALANVFIFFRPHQEHSEATLRQMAACEKEFAGKPVHWVAIVSGSWPKDEVQALAKETGIQMPVVVDEGDQLYGTLGVRLHPVVGIADGAGKLLAYQPFQKINYCDLVRARIQFALGEITAEQMDKVVHPDKALMPSDIKGAVANRHVKLGRMFVKSKNWEKAEEQAREAIAKEPTFAGGHLLLGDVFAAKGDCASAGKAYDEALRLEPGNAAAADAKKTCAAAK